MADDKKKLFLKNLDRLIRISEGSETPENVLAPPRLSTKETQDELNVFSPNIEKITPPDFEAINQENRQKNVLSLLKPTQNNGNGTQRPIEDESDITNVLAQRKPFKPTDTNTVSESTNQNRFMLEKQKKELQRPPSRLDPIFEGKKLTTDEDKESLKKFNSVYLPDGEHQLDDYTKEVELTNSDGEVDKEASKLFNEQRLKDRPKDFKQLKEFQQDLDKIEYLDKKYSTEGAIVTQEDERELRNLINKRNTLVGIHNNLTYGELEDYKLFNAVKRIQQLKNKTLYEKDRENVDIHIGQGLLDAIKTVTGSDSEYQSVKSKIRQQEVNEDIQYKFNNETNPHTIIGKTTRGLTTTAALAPLFALSFSMGGMAKAVTLGEKIWAAVRGSIPTFAPGGVNAGVNKTIAEVKYLESKGEKLNTFEKIGLYTKNITGETFKAVMEPVSEILIPGLNPAKSFFKNVLKKASLGIAYETGTEQITDVTGDLVDGTNSSILVSLLNTNKISKEAAEQFIVESIIAALYGSTVGGGEFWGGHLKEMTDPATYKNLNKYINDNKKQLEKNISNILDATTLDKQGVDQAVLNELNPKQEQGLTTTQTSRKDLSKGLYNVDEGSLQGTMSLEELLGKEVTPQPQEGLTFEGDIFGKQGISPEEAISNIKPFTPARQEGLTQEDNLQTLFDKQNKRFEDIENRRQKKIDAKEDANTYSQLSARYYQAQRKKQIINEQEFAEISQNIPTPEIKTKAEALFSKVQEQNKRLIDNNAFTLENLSKRLFKTKDINSLTDDQQKQLLFEFNDFKKQGLKEFGQIEESNLNDLREQIRTRKEQENALRQRQAEEILQRQQEEIAKARSERERVESGKQGTGLTGGIPEGTEKTKEGIPETKTVKSKEEVKNDNILQLKIMQEAGIPEEEMPDYALSSVADGKLLRDYINEIKSGELTEEEAAERVKRDYDKMKSGKKEGKFIEPEEPTQAQKEAGNYKKEHIRKDGLEISIENKAGTIRSGTDKDGETWQIEMKNDYGYIRGTVGKDKDHIDSFLNDNYQEGANVYIVNQTTPEGKFDEHKVMLGFPSMREARLAYISNYEEGKANFSDIVEMPMDEFKEWSKNKELTKKPAAQPKAGEGEVKYHSGNILKASNKSKKFGGKEIKTLDEALTSLEENNLSGGETIWFDREANTGYAYHQKTGEGGYEGAYIIRVKDSELKSPMSFEGGKEKVLPKDSGLKIDRTPKEYIITEEGNKIPVFDAEIIKKMHKAGEGEVKTETPETTTENVKTTLEDMPYDEAKKLSAEDYKKWYNAQENKRIKQEYEKTVDDGKKIYAAAGGNVKTDRETITNELLSSPKYKTPNKDLKKGLEFLLKYFPDIEVKSQTRDEVVIDIGDKSLPIDRYHLKMNPESTEKIHKGEWYDELKKKFLAKGEYDKLTDEQADERIFPQTKKKLTQAEWENYIEDFDSYWSDLKDSEYLEEISEKYMGFTDSGHLTFELTDRGKELLDDFNRRLETREGVKRGEDLFPEYAGIPDEEFLNQPKFKEKISEQEASDIEAIAEQAEAIIEEEESDLTDQDKSETIEQIDTLVNEIDEKLKLLGYYSAEGDKDGPHENASREPERKFKKDLTKFANELKKGLGYEDHFDKKGKKNTVNTNIPPSGGDGTIILWKPNSDYGVYISIDVVPMRESSEYMGERDSEALKITSFGQGDRFMWRVTTKQDVYTGLSNQWAKNDITAGEFARLIKREVDRAEAEGTKKQPPKIGTVEEQTKLIKDLASEKKNVSTIPESNIPKGKEPKIKVTIKENDRGGIDIFFTEKPSDAIISKMKLSSFRWTNSGGGHWWAMRTDKRLELANQIKREVEGVAPITSETLKSDDKFIKDHIIVAGIKPVEAKESPYKGTIYGKNYDKLTKLFPNLTILKQGDYFRMTSGGYMPLTVEVRSNNKDEMVLYLSHNYIKNGDLMDDPFMSIRVMKNGGVEALEFQQSEPAKYDAVYDEKGNVNQRVKKDLNDFLGIWLNNLVEQGFPKSKQQNPNEVKLRAEGQGSEEEAGITKATPDELKNRAFDELIAEDNKKGTIDEVFKNNDKQNALITFEKRLETKLADILTEDDNANVDKWADAYNELAKKDKIKELAEQLYNKMIGKTLTSDRGGKIPTNVPPAKQLGMDAFKAGKKRIAAQDPEFMSFIRSLNLNVGSAQTFMDQWYKGWDEANLKEPIPEKPKEAEYPFRDNPRTEAIGTLTGGSVDKIEAAGYEFVKGEFKKDSPEYWFMVGKIAGGKTDQFLRDKGKYITIRKKEQKPESKTKAIYPIDEREQDSIKAKLDDTGATFQYKWMPNAKSFTVIFDKGDIPKKTVIDLLTINDDKMHVLRGSYSYIQDESTITKHALHFLKNAEEIKKPETKLKQKIKSIENDELKDAFDDFISGINVTSGFDPVQMAKGMKLMGIYAKLGVYKFADIISDAYTRIGEDVLRKAFEYIKAAYGAYYNTAPDDIANQMDASVRGFDIDKIISTLSQGDKNELTGNEGERKDIPSGIQTEGLSGTEKNKPTGRLPGGQGTENVPGIQQTGEGTGGKTRGAGSRSGEGDSNKPTSEGDTNRPGNTGLEQSTGRGREQRGNYRITEADKVGAGPFNHSRNYKNNVDAIKLAKEIISEKRQATPEEKSILVKYVGWGGMSKSFHKQGYNYEYDQLKDLLTPEEFNAARASTTNAHYTSPEIIQGMWRVLEYLGFKGGKILEPGMGVGHFFGLMPDSIEAVSKLYGVELDDISTQIATLLYEGAKINDGEIKGKGFQEIPFLSNNLDLAISNVPFGDPNTRIHDDTEPRAAWSNKYSLHNYYFAKSLDKVKPGGMIAFITTHYTLDSKDSSFREYLAQRADLVAAIRLPNNAFKKNANTEVVTDIIFLRKKNREGLEEVSGTIPKRDWIQTVNKDIEGYDQTYNKIFDVKPEFLLGEHSSKGSMYGENEYTVVPKKDTPIEQQFEGLLSEDDRVLPKNLLTIMGNRQVILPEQPDAPSAKGTKKGGLTVIDKKVYRRKGNELVEEKDLLKEIKRIEELKNLSTKLDLAIDAQKNLTDDKELQPTMARLNDAYDTFVRKFGEVNSKYNKKIFRDDLADYPKVQSLEKIDKDGKITKHADIFNKRVFFPEKTISKSDTPKEALLASLNQKNKVDIEYMAELLGRPAQEIFKELEGLIYKTPDGNYVTADEYISGDVKTKLEWAERAAEDNPEYQVNVDALKAVIPKDIEPINIWADLGSTWIPTSYYMDFINEILGSENIKVTYISKLAQFIVTVDDWHLRNSPKNIEEFGIDRYPAIDLFKATLNFSNIAVYDAYIDDAGNEKKRLNQDKTIAAKDKQEKLVNEFKKWMWSNVNRAQELKDLYNKLRNRDVSRKFDGQHLTFPGMAKIINGKEFNFHPHQKNAIWRTLQTGNALLAHVVGSGKTYTMITAGMEMKRLGLRNKIAHVVMPNTLSQYAESFRAAYPLAKLLVATKADLKKENRSLFMSKIATNDWDAIVMAHSSFGLLPVSDQVFMNFMNEQIEDLEDAIRQAKAMGGGKKSEGARIVKELEKAKKRLEEKIKKRAARDTKDVTINYDDLGIDYLFIDEADTFKNLYTPTKLTRMPGINTTMSGRAFDMYMKINALYKQYGNGVTFATGTPVSNTLSELFIMQRYLQPETLKEKGIYHLDAWVHDFGAIVTQLELTPEGNGYRQKTRFNGLRNLPELMKIYGEVADLIRYDDIKDYVKRPDIKGGKAEVKDNEPSEIYLDFLQRLAARAKAVRDNKVEKTVDNMLKVTNDGRKASLDLRLIDKGYPDLPTSKVNTAAELIHDIWAETKSFRGTQLVFCDLGTPKTGSKLNIIKDALEDDFHAPADLVKTIKAAKNIEDAKAIARDFLTPATYDELLKIVENPQDVFNIYADLKKKLISKGIPSEQIKFIHDAKNEKQQGQLFDDVNNGQVRVLVGSTGKMGAGTNVQKRLYAEHHLDAPWRPRDIEQREGRILRQGNEIEEFTGKNEVRILRYVTKGAGQSTGFDSYLWQILENKARGIAMTQSLDIGIRTVEEIEGRALSYAEIKALASGNPYIFEKVQVDTELYKLERLLDEYTFNQYSQQRKLSEIPGWIDKTKRMIETYDEFIKISPKEEYQIKIEGKTYKIPDKSKDAGDKINDMARDLANSEEHNGIIKIGEMDNFDIELVKTSGFISTMTSEYYNEKQQAFVTMQLRPRGVSVMSIADIGITRNLSANLRESGGWTINNMNNIFENLKEKRKSEQAYIDRETIAQEDLKRIIAQPFDRADRLQELRKRSAELNLILKVREGEESSTEEGGNNEPKQLGEGENPDEGMGSGESDIIEPPDEDRFISDKLYNDSLNDIKNFSMTSGMEPKQLKAYAVVGAYHLENLFKSAGEKADIYVPWYKQMIKDFGEKIRRHLRKIWHEAKRILGEAKQTIKDYVTGERAILNPNTLVPIGGGELNTKTDAFKKWFGNSKVVDENGKPLVVYHGTKRGKFNEFSTPNELYYFTGDKSYAERYTRRPLFEIVFTDENGKRIPKDSDPIGRIKPKLYEVYLSLQNPLIIGSIERGFVREGGDTSTFGISKNRIAELKNQGYDGIINYDSKEYVAFYPTQIKSIYNKGTFNPQDANILASDPLFGLGQKIASMISSRTSAEGTNERSKQNLVDENYGLSRTLKQSGNAPILKTLGEGTSNLAKGISEEGKKFMDQFTTPPPVKAQLDKTFRPFYNIAERRLNREYVGNQNEILRKTVNDFKDFRKLNKTDRTGLLEALDDYHHNYMYRGTFIATNMGIRGKTVEEIIEKYDLNPAQELVLRQFDELGIATLELVKKGEKEMLFEYKKDISGMFSKEEFIQVLPQFAKYEEYMDAPLDDKVMNDVWNNDPLSRSKLADFAVERKYQDYGKYFYMNLSRPLEGYKNPFQKGSWIVHIEKPIDPKVKDSQIKRIFTYFENEADAKQFYEDAEKEGWTLKDRITQVGDLLNSVSDWGKLDQTTLLHLFNTSNIEIPKEVVDQLLKTVKEGYWEKHTIQRNYTPGLKWNAKETEQNIVNLLSESSGKRNKLYGIAKLNEMLTELENNYGKKVREVGIDENELAKLKRTMEYTQKFVSGLKYANNNALNSIRGLMYLWDLGFFRPSFMLQQATENFQTVMNLAIAEGGFVNGETDFIKAGKDMFEISAAIVEEKLYGQPRIKIDTDLWNVITKLRDMEKVSPLGVKVLFGESGDPKIHYDNFGKTLDAIKNTLSAGGQGIEYITRIHTAATFYRIAKRKGMTDINKITNYVADMIDLGKANYAKTGTIVALNPRTQKGYNEKSIGRMLANAFLVYKKWAAANTGLYRYLWNRSKTAFLIKALIGTGLHGVKKFPLIAGLYGIASLLLNLFDDDKEELDYKVLELENKLNEEVGGKIGSVLNRGIGTYFAVDLSGLMQEGSAVATDVIAPKIADIKSIPQALYEAPRIVTEAVMGRPYTFSTDIIAGAWGLTQLAKGGLTDKEEQRARTKFVRALPSTIRSFYQSDIMDTEGLKYRNKTLMKPKDITDEELLIKRWGFQPERFMKAYDELGKKTGGGIIRPEIERPEIERPEIQR